MAKKGASKIKDRKKYDENFEEIRFPFRGFDAAIERVKRLRQTKNEQEETI